MIVAVVAHHSRGGAGALLAERLGGRLFLDEGHHGARWNHERVWEWAVEHEGEHLLVVEDDARPVAGFTDLARCWIDRYPDDLLSFFLGTGEPGSTLERKIARLMSAPGDHIAVNDLMHAVCYAIPTDRLDGMKLDSGAPDTELGRAWWRLTHRPILYPKASLVEHLDWQTVGSGSRYSYRRIARNLHDENRLTLPGVGG